MPLTMFAHWRYLSDDPINPIQGSAYVFLMDVRDGSYWLASPVWFEGRIIAWRAAAANNERSPTPTHWMQATDAFELFDHLKGFLTQSVWSHAVELDLNDARDDRRT